MDAVTLSPRPTGDHDGRSYPTARLGFHIVATTAPPPDTHRRYHPESDGQRPSEPICELDPDGPLWTQYEHQCILWRIGSYTKAPEWKQAFAWVTEIYHENIQMLRRLSTSMRAASNDPATTLESASKRITTTLFIRTAADVDRFALKLGALLKARGDLECAKTVREFRGTGTAADQFFALIRVIV